MNVLDYVTVALQEDDITFSDPDVARIFETARSIAASEWPEAAGRHRAEAEADRASYVAEAETQLRTGASSPSPTMPHHSCSAPSSVIPMTRHAASPSTS